ncbi:MAG: aminotransferase class III-fold pyridoxal phosphate-dependent enzyme [Spirochaetes bacterium]|nr:aminotransferase class III-fold pyridoxal phosphate-dependent enzyme [Spirochaetota bacterium]
MKITSPRLSLTDLLGEPYIDAVCAARAFVEGADRRALRKTADEKVDLYPAAFERRVDDLVPMVGKKVCDGLAASARGAGSRAFREATKTAAAPLTGLGFLRVGEDGRLYLTSKAEHYHLSVGHAFPGYRLLEIARRIGITNTTHNNTRGHVTRLAERELVAAANGLTRADEAELDRVICSPDPRTLNRVINLETGSLVVEAALKMVLARFHRSEKSSAEPPYAGRRPVLLVMGDLEGGIEANYHGTTTLTQVMRGLWPGLGAKLEESGAMLVRPVRINDPADFERALRQWDAPPYKVAAFFHEIVLMNYGAVRLEEAYLRRAYALCREHDVPAVADEIQSCAWSPELFLFREYGIAPDLVSVGKGFPGGEYPAARVIGCPGVDTLGLFGALVTNGQEEIASLAYLVTAAFVRANAGWVRDVGKLYEAALDDLVARHPGLLARREGLRHLSSLFFHDAAKATAFAAALNAEGIDISVQSYKANCPSSCLTKLPLTVTPRAVEFLAGRMDAALRTL